MIDIMALRQLYKRRKIIEVRWIRGKGNPTDSITKTTPNKSLQTFLNTNQLSVEVEAWVEKN